MQPVLLLKEGDNSKPLDERLRFKKVKTHPKKEELLKFFLKKTSFVKIDSDSKLDSKLKKKSKNGMIDSIIDDVEEKFSKKKKSRKPEKDKYEDSQRYSQSEVLHQDYNKLFSYLGELKATGYMYSHLEGQGEDKLRYMNGESSLKTEEVKWFVQRKVIQDVLGGSSDQGDPYAREKFALYAKCNPGEMIWRYSISMT